MSMTLMLEKFKSCTREYFSGEEKLHAALEGDPFGKEAKDLMQKLVAAKAEALATLCRAEDAVTEGLRAGRSGARLAESHRTDMAQAVREHKKAQELSNLHRDILEAGRSARIGLSLSGPVLKH